TFASGWTALSQPGYDVVNNTTGSLIKTAGHPGGITTGTILGTITFKAKATGSATIKATTDSLLLDKTNKNLLSGVQGAVNVSITLPSTANSQNTQSTSATLQSASGPSTAVTGQTGEQTAATNTPSSASTTQVA